MKCKICGNPTDELITTCDMCVAEEYLLDAGLVDADEVKPSLPPLGQFLSDALGGIAKDA